jgi:drug/metabolite transporter (DMT)-like permease
MVATGTKPKASRLPGAKLAPLGCLLAVGLLIGLTANVVRLAIAAGIGPLPLLLWSVLGAGLVLLAIAGATGHRPQLGRRRVEYFLMTGLLSIAVPNALAFSAIPRIGAGFVALTYALPPLLTYVPALLLGIERYRGARALGVLFGIAGAAVLAAAKIGGGAVDTPWVVAALAAPVVVAAGNIYRTLRWPPGATAIELAPGMLLASALLLLAFAALAGLPVSLPLDRGAALGLLAAQAAIFAVMYTLYFVLQRLAGPVYLSQIGSVGAVSGAAIAILALGEAPPEGLPAAAVLIVAGVALVNRRR